MASCVQLMRLANNGGGSVWALPPTHARPLHTDIQLSSQSVPPFLSLLLRADKNVTVMQSGPVDV